jgi:RNA polymerase sigma-70 factor (ECF subfamily)
MPENNNIKAWFGQQIELHMDSLFALAMRLTRNATDAEDLVADSVSKAWSAIDTLEDKRLFKPWLMRILHNRFISDYRKKSVRPKEISFEESPANHEGDEVASLLISQPDEFLNWWANPEREFYNNLLGEDILSAIERLPETFRVTVVLINIEGLSYDEAAQVLNVSPGTIRSRMNRGRTLLQKALWEYAKDAGLISDVTLMECRT